VILLEFSNLDNQVLVFEIVFLSAFLCAHWIMNFGKDSSWAEVLGGSIDRNSSR
jgi:hypothetical protein